ncbi:hypothetical protein ACFWPU_30310 [Streptomyces sp. NPDC058471]|uniref:hypothetical protein n=1 Tax=Streptomyces sp. NPDC058471 TaxID=3346516 RepID=UPI003648804A
MNTEERPAPESTPSPTGGSPVATARLDDLGLDIREVDVPGTEDALDAFFGDL